MIQYNDNSFSEITNVDDLFEQVTSIKRFPPEWKAVHFGLREELEKVKTTEERLSEIESEIDAMKPIKTSLIIPTPEEIARYK